MESLPTIETPTSVNSTLNDFKQELSHSVQRTTVLCPSFKIKKSISSYFFYTAALFSSFTLCPSDMVKKTKYFRENQARWKIQV